MLRRPFAAPQFAQVGVMTDSENWSDYWQDEGQSGEVFVDASGRKHPALTRFWTDALATLPDASTVVDIACGAGSVFAEVAGVDRLQLFANDISADAVELLQKRMPAVSTRVADAKSLPYDDRSFDRVVSQFGVEYAGLDAFMEAARLIKSGGSLVTLSHYRDGYIDSRNAIELDAANDLLSGRFIDHAAAVTRAVFADDRSAFDQAFARFQPAEQALAAAHDRHNQGVHAHLYAGFRQLFEHRDRYAEADIHAWLDDMRGEVDRTVLRLATMRSAALTAEHVAELAARFAAAGLVDVCIEPFEISGNDKPVAWQVSAHKP